MRDFIPYIPFVFFGTICAVAGYYLYRLARELFPNLFVARQPRAGTTAPQRGYTSLWQIPGNKNFRWLMIGAAASISVGLLIALVAVGIVYWFMPAGQPTLIYLAAALLGLMLGYELVKPLFDNGRFTVKPGETAFRSVLGIPFDQMGVGQSWQIPGLMKEKVVDSQAFVVTNNPEVFVSANGVNLTAQMSSTVSVVDPLEYQKLKPGEAATVTGRLLSSLTRAYISNQAVELDMIGTLKGLSPTEQWKFVQKMLGFKGDISKNGPEAVRILMNKELSDYGLEVEQGQVQVNQLSLPKNVEEAIEDLFKEIFEKISKINDIGTKAEVAAILGDTFKKGGVDFGKLSQEQLLDLIGANLDRALANEGNATVYAFHSRGGNAPGVMINPNSTKH